MPITGPQPIAAPAHSFHAVAFVENLSLKQLAASYPEARRTPQDLSYATAGGGTVFIYPFGAIVFHNVDAGAREVELDRLRRARPGLTSTQAYDEQFMVREDPGARPDVAAGALTLDRMTFERASVVALIIAQSAAMEYYDRIVDDLFAETDKLVTRLEKTGSVIWNTGKLNRFVGTAAGTRNEVLSGLHLLDKPDAIWDDPDVDRIYDELRAEFDLVDRHAALERKLGAVQDSLELVLDVARDRRLVLLEASIVLLIVVDIVLSLAGL